MPVLVPLDHSGHPFQFLNMIDFMDMGPLRRINITIGDQRVDPPTLTLPNFHIYSPCQTSSDISSPIPSFFVTCVTNQRQPYLKTEKDLQLLMATTSAVQKIHPFTLHAYVLLPDHFHWLIQMPEDRPDFSKVVLSLKWNYSLNYKQLHKINLSFNLWQRGYYDHVIGDERDYINHLNYIHWNPVKHKLAQSPEDWKYSSYNSWDET